MTRYVAIWSLKRGIIDPPEPLDAAGQHLANMETQEAYRSVCYERDSPLNEEQEWMEELGRRTFPNQTRTRCA